MVASNSMRRPSTSIAISQTLTALKHTVPPACQDSSISERVAGDRRGSPLLSHNAICVSRSSAWSPVHLTPGLGVHFVVEDGRCQVYPLTDTDRSRMTPEQRAFSRMQIEQPAHRKRDRFRL